MNNNGMMIMELVNAGCDLRKLSPEFLEKLCEVYDGKATVAPVAEAHKITRADVINTLMIAKAAKEVRARRYGPSDIELLIDDLIDGIDLNHKQFISHFKSVRSMDSIAEVREAIHTLNTYIEEHTTN